jgi:hypothetical protein
MQFFKIYTLVDITRTQVFKEYVDSLKKRQQDNFNTLHQTLELRGNVYFDSDPKICILEWNTKNHKTWEWEFYTEHNDIFLLNEDYTGLIKQDLEFVPFINKCTETFDFKQCYFSFIGSTKNTMVEFFEKN